MRRFFMLCVVLSAASIVSLSTANADETRQTKTSEAAKDTNYRFHNGQWWYWMPKTENWKVWNGSEWTDYQAAPTVRTRGYSYNDAGATEGNAADWRAFGRPLVSVPDSVSTNNQIIGSFGFRGAGSKMIGNY